MKYAVAALAFLVVALPSCCMRKNKGNGKVQNVEKASRCAGKCPKEAKAMPNASKAASNAAKAMPNGSKALPKAAKAMPAAKR